MRVRDEPDSGGIAHVSILLDASVLGLVAQLKIIVMDRKSLEMGGGNQRDLSGAARGSIDFLMPSHEGDVLPGCPNAGVIGNAEVLRNWN